MAAAYFDTSVFLAVLAKQPQAAKVRSLLDELRADKVRIYTSILTLQEVSVSSFMHSQMFADRIRVTPEDSGPGSASARLT